MAHKGAVTAKINERDFPHGVIMPVPENGFGGQLLYLRIGIAILPPAGRLR